MLEEENSEYLSLSGLTNFIKEIFDMNFIDDVLMVAEIAELKVATSGHCYLELIEKKDNKIIARSRATIWSFQYQRIATNFFNATGETLRAGIKVLMNCTVSFHELYGVAINVKGIDPSYTLGDLDKKRKEILDRLKQEGLIAKNKSLELPFLPKRVAVVSSSKAAGYEDFIEQLEHNQNGYCFEVSLFDAVMQGEKVSESVRAALENIDAIEKNFDCVVIIRGGGANMDLVGFDDYELAKRIANFSLPVISGIGHERDHTIVDEVVNTKIKTPTAVAAFLIEKFQAVEEYIAGLEEALVYMTKDRLNKQEKHLIRLSGSFSSNVTELVKHLELRLNTIQTSALAGTKRSVAYQSKTLEEKITAMNYGVKRFNQNELHRLEGFKQRLSSVLPLKFEKGKGALREFEKVLELVDPQNILNRGYAMIKHNDKIIKSINDVALGDEVSILMKDGTVQSKVINNGKED